MVQTTFRGSRLRRGGRAGSNLRSTPAVALVRWGQGLAVVVAARLGGGGPAHISGLWPRKRVIDYFNSFDNYYPCIISPCDPVSLCRGAESRGLADIACRYSTHRAAELSLSTVNEEPRPKYGRFCPPRVAGQDSPSSPRVESGRPGRGEGLRCHRDHPLL